MFEMKVYYLLYNTILLKLFDISKKEKRIVDFSLKFLFVPG